MRQAVSRVTAQNQISVPAAVRRRFGIGPGTELLWEERDGRLEVRPKRQTLDEVQKILSRRPVPRLGLHDLRAAKVKAIVGKYLDGRR